MIKAYAEMSAGKARQTLSAGRVGTARQAGRLAEERAALARMTPNQLRQSGRRYQSTTRATRGNAAGTGR